jgi:hypothetical protein
MDDLFSSSFFFSFAFAGCCLVVSGRCEVCTSIVFLVVLPWHMEAYRLS